jgi:hypothetical protein
LFTWILFEPKNSFSNLIIRSKYDNSRIRFSSKCNSIRFVWKKNDVSVITRILFLSKTNSRKLRNDSRPSTFDISFPKNIFHEFLYLKKKISPWRNKDRNDGILFNCNAARSVILL